MKISHYLLLVFLFVIAFFIREFLPVLFPKARRRSSRWPLQSNRFKYVAKPVLTPRERQFYFLLSAAFPEFIVLSQVTFSRFLQPDGPFHFMQYLQNKISQKSADFVIVDRDFSVLAVVELDDSTHDLRKFQDAQRDAIVQSAGIQVYRFDGRCMPTSEQIRLSMLGGSTVKEDRSLQAISRLRQRS